MGSLDGTNERHNNEHGFTIVQHLKEELKEKILGAARTEFMLHGFRDASMRTIARNAGVVTGNLYRYFSSKKALFESLVKPAYDGITSLAFDDERMGRKPRSQTAFVDPVTDALVALHARYGGVLLVLVEGSAGTAYENTKAELVDLVAGLFEREMRFTEKQDVFLSRLVIAAFVDAFFTALKEYGNDDTGLQEILRRLLSVFFKNIDDRLAEGKA